MTRFDIVDTTFREGQQSPLLFDVYKYYFSLEDKKRLFNALARLGVRRFEFFSPIVSKREKEHFLALKDFAKKKNLKAKFFAHIRVHELDVISALEVGFDGLHFYLNLSKHGEKSYSKEQKELIEKAVKIISSLRKKYPKLYLRFSGEDAFRTPLKRLFYVYDKLYPYVNAFGLPDTVGIAIPEKVKRRIKVLKKRYPKVLLEVHFHNDRGFSLVNALSAVKAGAELVDTTVWGLGERSGITSITGLLLNLYLEDKKLVERFNLELCYPLNVLMGTILGLQVPFNEAVSLTNRTHIAGVHQKAILRYRKIYEAIDLGKFGVNKNQLLLGPLSGVHLVYYFLKEIKGYKISFSQAREITREFKNSFDGILPPEEFLVKLVERKNFAKHKIPEKYSSFRIEVLE